MTAPGLFASTDMVLTRHPTGQRRAFYLVLARHWIKRRDAAIRWGRVPVGPDGTKQMVPGHPI